MRYLLVILIFLFSVSCSTENDYDDTTFSLSTSVSPLESAVINPSEGVYNKGESIEVEALPNEGWVFKEWQGDMSSQINPIQLTMNMNYELKAIIEPNNYLKTFGGSGRDRGISTTKTFDGGYIITGRTNSNDKDFEGLGLGGDDIILIKLNSNGDQEWIRTYGGSDDDGGTDVIQSTDGGFIITGGSVSNDGDFTGLNKGGGDAFIMKVDSRGNIQWVKMYGGSNGDTSNGIKATNDGGFVIAGMHSSNDGDFRDLFVGDRDSYVLKVNNDGIVQWITTIAGSEYENIHSLTALDNGTIVVAGLTNSNDGTFESDGQIKGRLYLANLNSSGEMNWLKTFGGTGFDLPKSISSSTDGGLILTGRTDSNDGDFTGLNNGGEDILVMKLDSFGEIDWVQTFGGSEWQEGNSIIETSNGDFVLTGGFRSNDGDFSGLHKGNGDTFIIRLNNTGGLKWQATIGGWNSDIGESIVENEDGSLVVTGWFSSNDEDFSGLNRARNDIYIINFDPDGNITNFE